MSASSTKDNFIAVYNENPNLDVDTLLAKYKEKYSSTIAKSYAYRLHKKLKIADSTKEKLEKTGEKGEPKTEAITIEKPPIPATLLPSPPTEEKTEIPPMTEMDCQNLYAAPAELIGLFTGREDIIVEDARVKIQGTRLYQLFLKYGVKIEFAMELIFGFGAAIDYGKIYKKLRPAKEKKGEEKKEETPLEPKPEENKTSTIMSDTEIQEKLRGRPSPEDAGA